MRCVYRSGAFPPVVGLIIAHFVMYLFGGTFAGAIFGGVLFFGALFYYVFG